MRDIKSIIEGIVSQGRQVGSGGAAFRAASSSGSSGRHDHGIDIGAHRNQAHEVRAKDAAADRAKTREKEVEKRNKEAEQRRKEVSTMAKEETVTEGTFSKHETDHLKQMHARDSASISRLPSNAKYSHAGDTIDREYEIRKELKKRGHTVERPKHKLVIEDKMSSGTEARTKIKNVARMDDADPKSEKSTLGKTGQIKTKIIDEEKPLMSDKNFGLSASLIAAARQIVEKKHDDDGKDPKKMSGGKTAVDLNPETDDKSNDGDTESKSKKKFPMKEETKSHTVPKTDKDKKLAALAHPKDKITHKDVLVGRGVVKEEDDMEGLDATGDHLEAAHKKGVAHLQKALKGASTHHLQGLNHYNMGQSGSGTHPVVPHIEKELKRRGAHPQGSWQNEEVEQVDEAKAKQGYQAWPGQKKKAFFTNKAMADETAKWKARKDAERAERDAAAKKTNEEVEQVDEVSKATLSSYVKKVAALPPEKVKPSREKGIEMASKKLHKEDVEQIDELSPTTVASYRKKSIKNANKHFDKAIKSMEKHDETDHPRDLKKVDDHFKIFRRRTAGLERANRLNKEEVEFSEEEAIRIEKIAQSFQTEVDEAVKKSKTVPSATTATSSPVRGANQDQSGFGTKSSTADYTISDEKKLRKEEVELDEISQKLAGSYYTKATKQHIDKVGIKRNMYDRIEKDMGKKRKVGVDRALDRITGARKTNEELELEEGRGRPRKNPLPAGQETEGDDTHKHPMQQLEKISHAIEGNEPHFEHKDGSKSKVGRHLARHIVAIHNSMRTSQEKDNFAQKVHANRGSMKAEVSKHI